MYVIDSDHINTAIDTSCDYMRVVLIEKGGSPFSHLLSLSMKKNRIKNYISICSIVSVNLGTKEKVKIYIDALRSLNPNFLRLLLRNRSWRERA